MAWTAPMTAVANAIFTAAQFNTHVRDNLLETAPAKATTVGSIFVASGTNSISQRTPATQTQATAGTTSSATYVTALTSGTTCAVTVVTGTTALVMLKGQMRNTTAATNIVFMGYAVSGASTVAASDTKSISIVNSGNTAGNHDGAGFFHTGLTAGSNTFTVQHRTSGGTAEYANRDIIVIPF